MRAYTLADLEALENERPELGDPDALHTERISDDELVEQARADRYAAATTRTRESLGSGVTLICDTGALIALERNDRAMWRRLKSELRAGTSR